MTDATNMGAPSGSNAVHSLFTPDKRTAARNAAEKRFRSYGVVAISLAGAFLLAVCANAPGQADSREKPLVILEGVKQRELEGQIAMKQTELQRLNEDLQKRQSETAALQQSMDAIAIATGEANDMLEQLVMRKKYLARALELTIQRIDAEKLKVDGLKTLSDAQAKDRERVAKQFEATTIRSNIEGANFRILSQKQGAQEGDAGAKDSSTKLLSEIADLKKKLEKSDRNTAAALKLAREAMGSATAKLLQAENAEARAKKTAQEWGLNENAEPVAEKVDADPLDAAPLEKRN